MTVNSIDAANSLDAALRWATHELAGSESPHLDARLLLCQVLEVSQTYLMTWPERELSCDSLQAFQQLIDERRRGVPVAYLTGEREFWSLKFLTSEATLIPRPDTEVLVERALERSADVQSILDLGTGTGAIAIALAHELPQVSVTAVDVQENAVKLARSNAQRLNTANVSVKQGNWYEPVHGKRFGLIVSNPPYIDGRDPHLSTGDVRFEPRSALVAKEDGLADLRHIVQLAPEYLEPAGWLLLEHGYEQGKAVRQIYIERGFANIETCRDYGGQERLTLGCWKTLG